MPVAVPPRLLVRGGQHLISLQVVSGGLLFVCRGIYVMAGMHCTTCHRLTCTFSTMALTMWTHPLCMWVPLMDCWG